MAGERRCPGRGRGFPFRPSLLLQSVPGSTTLSGWERGDGGGCTFPGCIPSWVLVRARGGRSCPRVWLTEEEREGFPGCRATPGSLSVFREPSP